MNLTNLKEVVNSCITSNQKVVNEPMEIRSNVWVAIIQDPDGNLIELMQDGTIDE